MESDCIIIFFFSGREAALLGVQGPCPVGCNSVNVYIWMVNVGCSLLTRVRASPRLFT